MHQATIDGKRFLQEQPFFLLRQQRNQPVIQDIPGTVRHQLELSHLKNRLQPGARVAVAVGSRGIADLNQLVMATLDTLLAWGMQPFVVAAMGSHGGATAQGQAELLASYGITPERLGVPVSTHMETVLLGQNDWNEPVYWDRQAFEADAVLPIARIKAHTDFTGDFESGLTKMLVIGLGKREGASVHHQYGVRGLRDMLPLSAQVVVAKTRFLAGLAVIENAACQLAHIEVVEMEDLFTTEPKLLKLAKSLAGRLPMAELDLLVVGELGKNFSGTGMDVHVIGRHMVEGEPEPWQPRVTRLCVLDVSDESHGNAVGAGLADLTTQRLLSRRDETITMMNYLTSCFLLRAKTPFALPTDLACIAEGVRTCWEPRADKLRMAVIPNTLEITELWVSTALHQSVQQRSDLEVVDCRPHLPFSEDGQLRLDLLFPRIRRFRSHAS